MKVYRRSIASYSKSIGISFLVGLLCLIISTAFFYQPLIAYGMPVLAFAAVLILSLFFGNTKITLNGNKLQYLQSRKSARTFVLGCAPVQYRVASESPGWFTLRTLDLYLPKDETGDEKEHIDCSLLGEKQFLQLIEEIRQHAQVERLRNRLLSKK